MFERDTGVTQDALLLGTLLGTDGNYHQRDLINFWGAICFSPDIDDAVFERWMDVLNFTSSEDGYVYTAMGLKGVDWDRDENGELVSLLEEGVILAEAPGIGKYPSLGHVLGSVILWDDLALSNPNIGKAHRDASRALYMTRYEHSTPETFAAVDWDLWMHFSPAMRTARGIDYRSDYANLITTATSEDHLVELYNQWIAERMPVISPVLHELNALGN
ncbi:MAG: hypothetical protein FWD08_07130 [Alphaproteobacteria bacterium]|nr:hypothetical protein [Alphaproteobacteria bacterium]